MKWEGATLLFPFEGEGCSLSRSAWRHLLLSLDQCLREGQFGNGSRHWVLAVMQQSCVLPGVFSYSAVISACEKG